MIKGLDIISSEFEAVVEIFPSIESYVFGAPELIDDNQIYPCLLFNSQRTTSVTNKVLNTGMPKTREYSCRAVLYLEYSEEEKKTITLSEKYEEAETILAQYIAKLYKRGRNNLSSISINGLYNSDYAEKQNHDSTVSVGFDIQVFLIVGNCDEGIFTDVNAPTSLTATTSGNDLNLSWTDNSSNEDGFYIYRSSSYSGSYSLIGTNAAGDTTFTDSAPTKDVTWFYKVRAFEGTVLSAWSNVVTGYVSSGGASSYEYNVLIDGVDSGQDVTIDGTNVTINLI